MNPIWKSKSLKILKQIQTNPWTSNTTVLHDYLNRKVTVIFALVQWLYSGFKGLGSDLLCTSNCRIDNGLINMFVQYCLCLWKKKMKKSAPRKELVPSLHQWHQHITVIAANQLKLHHTHNLSFRAADIIHNINKRHYYISSKKFSHDPHLSRHIFMVLFKMHLQPNMYKKSSSSMFSHFHVMPTPCTLLPSCVKLSSSKTLYNEKIVDLKKKDLSLAKTGMKLNIK